MSVSGPIVLALHFLLLSNDSACHTLAQIMKCVRCSLCCIACIILCCTDYDGWRLLFLWYPLFPIIRKIMFIQVSLEASTADEVEPDPLQSKAVQNKHHSIFPAITYLPCVNCLILGAVD